MVIMELIDTPNPNAKKILIDHALSESEQASVSTILNKIKGVSSVFWGPGFTTITKNENIEWESINEDIINIFDKL